MSWSDLSAAVDAGELSMERGTARLCAARCTELIDQLRTIRRQVHGVTKVEGLGPLPSGIALARKFELKASGGEYSMDRAIDDHIAEAERMRGVFERIEARYASAEDANVAALTRTAVSVESSAVSGE